MAIKIFITIFFDILVMLLYLPNWRSSLYWTVSEYLYMRLLFMYFKVVYASNYISKGEF